MQTPAAATTGNDKSLRNAGQHRRGLMTLLFLLILTVAGGGLAQPAAEPGARWEGGEIVVTGEGLVYGEPDRATVQVGANSEDEDVREAVAQVDEAVRRIIDALAELGIAERNIKTISYNVWRQDRYEPLPQGGEERRSVFRAEHMLSVTVDGAQRAGEVLAASVDAGANAVGGIRFEFADPARVAAQARDAAVQDAVARAQQLAAAAGVAVGDVLIIEELAGGSPTAVGLQRAVAFASDAAPVSPGELSVRVSVRMRFAIDQ